MRAIRLSDHTWLSSRHSWSSQEPAHSRGSVFVELRNMRCTLWSSAPRNCLTKFRGWRCPRVRLCGDSKGGDIRSTAWMKSIQGTEKISRFRERLARVGRDVPELSATGQWCSLAIFPLDCNLLSGHHFGVTDDRSAFVTAALIPVGSTYSLIREGFPRNGRSCAELQIHDSTSGAEFPPCTWYEFTGSQLWDDVERF
jgi:hypothetical protein